MGFSASIVWKLHIGFCPVLHL